MILSWSSGGWTLQFPCRCLESFPSRCSHISHSQVCCRGIITFNAVIIVIVTWNSVASLGKCGTYTSAFTTVSTLTHQGRVMYNHQIIVINLLGPSDDIWRHRAGSTLAQVMACCLTALSHYLNQYWLIISQVQSQSPAGNFTRDTSAINELN